MARQEDDARAHARPAAPRIASAEEALAIAMHFATEAVSPALADVLVLLDQIEHLLTGASRASTYQQIVDAERRSTRARIELVAARLELDKTKAALAAALEQMIRRGFVASRAVSAAVSQITLTAEGRPQAIEAWKAQAAEARQLVLAHRRLVTPLLESLALGNWDGLEDRAAELIGGLKKLVRLTEDANATDAMVARLEAEGAAGHTAEGEP